MSANEQQDALLARQPIYNTKLDIWAYELLFRGTATSAANNEADISCGDSATSQVLLNAFGDNGLESICGDHPALINFTKNLILDLPPFNPQKYVIEILEDIEVDDELIQAIIAAKKSGARLALDDFILDHNSAPLLHLVDFIKVDVLAVSKEQIKRFAEVFLPRRLKLLAEKVETHEMYEYCKDLGYEYFQGYFLSRPQIVEGKQVADNKLVVLKLLKDLQDPDIGAKQLSETLSVDPQLSFKLLTLVNSAAFARVKKCTSLQQAIAAMGFNMIRSWASLIALGRLEDKPAALHHSSIERAIFCQALGETLGNFDSFEYYTVGLFSMLDAYLDIPISQVIEKLHLADDLKDAILNETSNLGMALKIAKCYQEGRLDDLDFSALNAKGLDQAQIQQHYTSAIAETDRLITAL